MPHFYHGHGGFIPYGGYYGDNYGYGYGASIPNIIGGLVNILPQIFGQRFAGPPAYMDAGDPRMMYGNPQAQWGGQQWGQNPGWNRPVTGYPMPNMDIHNPIERDAAIDSGRIAQSLQYGQQPDLGLTQRHLDKAIRCDQASRLHGRQTDFFGRLVANIDRDLQQRMGGRYRFVDNQSTGWRPQIVDTQQGYYQQQASVAGDSDDYT